MKRDLGSIKQEWKNIPLSDYTDTYMVLKEEVVNTVVNITLSQLFSNVPLPSNS